ncbi:MAG: PaaI family thioesterase [Acidimicrobiales bacterium]|jgi:hypothetical protein|nr:PaaI family thioesterase [Acidimicrobiales bacterium]
MTPEPVRSQVAEHARTEALADATRRLVAAVRMADAPGDDLDEAAALVMRAARLLEPHVVEATTMQAALRPEVDGMLPAPADDPSAFFPYSPVVGPLNVLAPPVRMHFDGERMHGTTTLGPPYGGPPASVHGGIIALIFDELLGSTNVCLGMGAFTGTLSVRYERTTPIGAELALEAWLDRIEGRKVFTKGTIGDAGGVTARAEGIFIRYPES